MTLGNKLKKLRMSRGLTQKDIADQLHVSFQTISKWESGINEPDIATLKELAKLYECSIDFLLNDTEEENEEEKETDKEINPPQEIVNEPKVVYVHELHVCARCGKDIPEDDLVSEDVKKKSKTW